MAKQIRPIVEFFTLDCVETRRGGKYELFADDTTAGATHRYYDGVKQDLNACSGIYIFYDSRGRALYAGKAVEQSLWRGMNSVYNRSRDEVQRVKLVSHPYRNVAYRTSDEVKRRIWSQPIKLHDLAYYFSAYEIRPKNLIGMFEALIIRAFANDLLNIKMESFD